MGGRYSKGPIRKDARPLLPAAWDELVALERWLSINNVLFVTDLATLQAWMPTKDVGAAKRVFTYPFCALDLLGAFALLQHGAPTTRKLECVYGMSMCPFDVGNASSCRSFAQEWT